MIKDEVTFKWPAEQTREEKKTKTWNNNDLIAPEMHCVEKLYFRI